MFSDLVYSLIIMVSILLYSFSYQWDESAQMSGGSSTKARKRVLSKLDVFDVATVVENSLPMQTA